MHDKIAICKFTCMNCDDTGWVEHQNRIYPCHICNAPNWGVWADNVVSGHGERVLNWAWDRATKLTRC